MAVNETDVVRSYPDTGLIAARACRSCKPCDRADNGCDEERAMRTLQINGKSYRVEVPDDMPLLWVLRDVVGLTGTKFGCGIAQCGACTVHVDGQAVRSCVTRVGTIGNRGITTIEGIGATTNGRALQGAWLALQVPQCGYCQPGQIMSAAALLAAGKPNDAQIDATMAGNICRCCTYVRIRAAIKRAVGGETTAQGT